MNVKPHRVFVVAIYGGYSKPWSWWSLRRCRRRFHLRRKNRLLDRKGRPIASSVRHVKKHRSQTCRSRWPQQTPRSIDRPSAKSRCGSCHRRWTYAPSPLRDADAGDVHHSTWDDDGTVLPIPRSDGVQSTRCSSGYPGHARIRAGIGPSAPRHGYDSVPGGPHWLAGTRRCGLALQTMSTHGGAVSAAPASPTSFDDASVTEMKDSEDNPYAEESEDPFL